jgi:NitT/TauT family transport system substrate-binding protein
MIAKIALTFIAVAWLSAVACMIGPEAWAQAAPTSPAQSVQPRRVTIAQVADFFLYAPIYLAQDSGFFEKRRLSVSITNTGGDEKTWAAVFSGEADFGVGDPTFVAISGVRGKPGKVISSIVNGVPFWGVTFDPKIPIIKEPRDLNGYAVATFPAPSTAYSLQKKMFTDGGLRENIRQGAFGTLLPMLQSGQAQIALELEPNVSQAVLSGARVVYSLAQLYGDFAITGLTATPRFLDKNKDVAGDVVCALQMALDFAHKDPEKATALLLKRFPDVRPEAAHLAYQRVLGEGIIPLSTSTAKAAWQKAIALRVEIGDLPSGDVGDFGAYVDNSYADAAIRECR